MCVHGVKVRVTERGQYMCGVRGGGQFAWGCVEVVIVCLVSTRPPNMRGESVCGV